MVAPKSSADAAVVKGECVVNAIGQFDNWNPQECAVGNADHWKSEVSSYLETAPEIPKVIHQIWIGDREPPCVWLDTWRIDFLNSPAGKGWSYKLWDNDAVENLEMINRDLYDREGMFQCKADILRLELLYCFGGVYCDADLVWLKGLGLDEVWESCRDSKFLCGYEPDTKDKPYSVLGNSIFFVCRGHPIMRLLISYIAQIYDAKRPHNTVEWVTGPLAFTKALVHTKMPFTVPEQRLFYPAFHFQPNPCNVDLAAFPGSIGFQFGYSCSGLTEWVKNNNRCRRALDCPHHQKKTDYPLGSILPFPARAPDFDSAPMPLIIHQFHMSSTPLPLRWVNAWADFAASQENVTHKVWTYETLAELGGFFCANMYPPKGGVHFDADTIILLALEVLYKQGGVYVPLSTLFRSSTEVRQPIDSVHWPFVVPAGGEIVRQGPVLSSRPGAEGVLSAIKHCHETGRPKLPPTDSALSLLLEVPGTNGRVLDQGIGDEVSMYASFADESQFLGVSEMLVSRSTASSRGVSGADLAAVANSYRFMAPVAFVDLADMAHVQNSCTNASTVFVIDTQMVLLPNMLDAVPGFIHDVSQIDENWSYILVAIEWEAGVNGNVVYRPESGMRSSAAIQLAVILREGKRAHLPKSFDNINAVADWVLNKRDEESVFCSMIKYADTEEVSGIYQAMPVVESVFRSIADHQIPSWDRDETEIHGGLLKGLIGGQMAFELQVDEEKRIMYRAFNHGGGGLNCEIKIVQGAGGRNMVDHVRVFRDHQVVFEGQQLSC